jgi:hypothetical protein
MLIVAGFAFMRLRGARNNTASTNQTSSLPGDAVTEEFAIEIGDEINNGEPDSGAGLIEAPGSKDIYTFSAEPGQKIYVHVIEPPDTTDTVNFYLNDELEFNVFFSCLECGDPGVITLDRGGEYTLTVGNDDPTGAGYGSYRLKLWDVAPPDQFEIELDDEISRDEPDTGAGYIENPGSMDLYTFTADPGQDVYAQVVEHPTTGDTIDWWVEDEVGSVLFRTCMQCSDPGLITLDRGGLYTVVVFSERSHGTGTYAFKLWSVAPPDEFEINIGDTISRDRPGSGAGYIETPGALDIYMFTGIAGQTITLTLADMDLPELYWRLEDEAENELFNTCIQCGNPEPVTLPHDGEYKIIVGSENNPGTGVYEFEITEP